MRFLRHSRGLSPIIPGRPPSPGLPFVPGKPGPPGKPLSPGVPSLPRPPSEDINHVSHVSEIQRSLEISSFSYSQHQKYKPKFGEKKSPCWPLDRMQVSTTSALMPLFFIEQSVVEGTYKRVKQKLLSGRTGGAFKCSVSIYCSPEKQKGGNKIQS